MGTARRRLRADEQRDLDNAVAAALPDALPHIDALIQIARGSVVPSVPEDAGDTAGREWVNTVLRVLAAAIDD